MQVCPIHVRRRREEGSGLEELLRQFWLDVASQHVRPIWNSTAFWRYVAIALTTAFVLLFKYRDQVLDWAQPEVALEHDRRIFAELDAILPEPRLRWEFDNELFNHHTTIAFDESLSSFVDMAVCVGNQFLSKRCDKAVRGLTSRIRALQDFMRREFHATKSLPQGNAIIRLRPDLNCDLSVVDGDGMARYHELGEQLGRLVEDVDSSYRRFRKLVKKQLSV
jgi:hypothetical protein